MISVIIPADDSDEALAGLFAALVPAAVDGLVREVAVAASAPSQATKLLCEEAGARLVNGTIDHAAAEARGDWLLLVAPQMRFGPRWREAVAEHLAGSSRPALILPPARAGWLGGLGRAKAAGVLVRRRDFGPEAGDLACLRRRFGRTAVRLG